MKVAIYGAGAMGTILGAYITKARYDIDLINRNIEHVEALKKSGANIVGKIKFNQKVKALLPEEMKDKYNIIFLMTKQRYNKEIVELLTEIHEFRGKQELYMESYPNVLEAIVGVVKIQSTGASKELILVRKEWEI